MVPTPVGERFGIAVAPPAQPRSRYSMGTTSSVHCAMWLLPVRSCDGKRNAGALAGCPASAAVGSVVVVVMVVVVVEQDVGEVLLQRRPHAA